MPKAVREPIQVYLTTAERAELDRAARDLGVSRSEALRLGSGAVAGTANAGGLRELAAAGYVTPPAHGPGAPPPSAPVAPLDALLAELADDRGRP